MIERYTTRQEALLRLLDYFMVEQHEMVKVAFADAAAPVLGRLLRDSATAVKSGRSHIADEGTATDDLEWIAQINWNMWREDALSPKEVAALAKIEDPDQGGIPYPQDKQPQQRWALVVGSKQDGELVAWITDDPGLALKAGPRAVKHHNKHSFRIEKALTEWETAYKAANPSLRTGETPVPVEI